MEEGNGMKLDNDGYVLAARRNARGFDKALEYLAFDLGISVDHVWDRLAVHLSNDGTSLEAALAALVQDMESMGES